MSDKEFKVSGDKDDLLQKTIDLVFTQSAYNAAASWALIKGSGIAFYWHKDLSGVNPLPVRLNSDGVYSIVKQWLASDDADKMRRKHEYQGGDGSYSNGWEIVNYENETNSFYQILLVKPVQIYYGK